ncbi:MAG: hypothetical protein CL858_26780 [Cupriavidus sp.]|uniref:Abi family protein n=1 Tax=Cupriavidus pauculus TaxID=82633 RepID=UPI000687AEB0|nr:Abi family protein [Cupriavidus pauculus]MBU67012.1 hypothetical protein [Cupriavidus sp.]MBU69002.1 hypothetical protein [Cupriavidus sp.]
MADAKKREKSMKNHFTAPRLATVERFFQSDSSTDLMGCYAWCQALSAALLPLLGDFEVSLRNALHRSLSQFYMGADSAAWMLPIPGPLRANAPHPKTPHSMSQIDKRDIATIVERRVKRGRLVSQDDVVAALSFGFWEQLVNGLGRGHHPNGLQGAVLQSAFPFAPSGTIYASAAFREQLVRLLKMVRDVRNRVGHHDAIWAIPEFDTEGHPGFIPRRPRHTLTSTKLFSQRVVWLASWIDPAIGAHIERSDHWACLQTLLSRQALATYRSRGGRADTYHSLITGHISLRGAKAFYF